MKSGSTAQLRRVRIRAAALIPLALALGSIELGCQAAPRLATDVSGGNHPRISHNFPPGHEFNVHPEILVGRYVLLRAMPKEEFRESSFTPLGAGKTFRGAPMPAPFANEFSPQSVNFHIVDLTTSKHHVVFEHPVAIEYFGFSGNPDLAPLHQLGILSFSARTSDTTADGLIDARDDLKAFVYSLPDAKRSQVSPDGFSVASVSYRGVELIITMREPQADKYAIYRYDAKAATGDFVARGISP